MIRLNRFSSLGSTMYGNLRGLGVCLQFKTPSISKKMIFTAWTPFRGFGLAPFWRPAGPRNPRCPPVICWLVMIRICAFAPGTEAISAEKTPVRYNYEGYIAHAMPMLWYDTRHSANRCG